MQITTSDRGYRTGCSRKRITAQSETAYAYMQRMTPRRGFLSPKPTFSASGYLVETYANFEHDDPCFAATYFSPVDAKLAMRKSLL